MAQVYGSNELFEDVHQRELCIGCGACVDLCPYFKNHRGKTSRLFACTLTQGRCYAYCPKAEVDLNDLFQDRFQCDYEALPMGVYRSVVAARAGRRMTEGPFQGGGTVSALMAHALESGLVDVAALTDRDGLVPHACLVTDAREVARHAGAKFMAAPTLAGVNQAVRQGYRRIGVVGTPCQMMALAQMRRNPLGKPEHHVPVGLAVGLFCNWALDTRQLIDLLAGRLNVKTIRAMDIPPPPANVMVLDTDQGPQTVSLSEIKPLIPHTCFICLDMTAELADVSVGMYEGRSHWNTLIVRTEAGDALVADAVRAGYLETEALPPEAVDHLSRASAAKKERSMRMLLQRQLLNSADGQRAALRLPEAVVDRILPSKPAH